MTDDTSETRIPPSVQRLKHLLACDFERGILVWKNASNPMGRGGGKQYIGKVAGGAHPSGYIYIAVDGKKYGAHRIVWAMAHGEWQPDGLHIDHIDGNPANNELKNLRLATRSQNQANRRSQGTKGVRLHACGKWEARLTAAGTKIYLGLHATMADAKEAYDSAAREHFEEFARA